jgi:hypothetical protein
MISGNSSNGALAWPLVKAYRRRSRMNRESKIWHRLDPNIDKRIQIVKSRSTKQSTHPSPTFSPLPSGHQTALLLPLPLHYLHNIEPRDKSPILSLHCELQCIRRISDSSSLILLLCFLQDCSCSCGGVCNCYRYGIIRRGRSQYDIGLKADGNVKSGSSFNVRHLSSRLCCVF